MSFYFILNAYWEPLAFELPVIQPAQSWRRWIDTGLRLPDDIVSWYSGPEVSGNTYRVAGRSVVLLYTFGSALIECYLLESKAPIVPRIVLTEPLQQLVANQESADAQEQHIESRSDQAICRDVDGWWFVNYLDAAVESGKVQWDLIERHKESVLQSLSHTTRHDVLPKYGWTCRYHNVFCHWHRDDPGYSDRYRINRVDEHSTIHRLGDTKN